MGTAFGTAPATRSESYPLMYISATSVRPKSGARTLAIDITDEVESGQYRNSQALLASWQRLKHSLKKIVSSC